MLKKILSTTVVLMLLFVAVGCENQGPAEKAGEKIDNTMEEVRDKSEDMTEKAAEKIDDAMEEVQDKAEDVADEAEDVIDRAEDKMDQ